MHEVTPVQLRGMSGAHGDTWESPWGLGPFAGSKQASEGQGRAAEVPSGSLYRGQGRRLVRRPADVLAQAGCGLAARPGRSNRYSSNEVAGRGGHVPDRLPLLRGEQLAHLQGTQGADRGVLLPSFFPLPGPGTHCTRACTKRQGGLTLRGAAADSPVLHVGSSRAWCMAVRASDSPASSCVRRNSDSVLVTLALRGRGEGGGGDGGGRKAEQR